MVKLFHPVWKSAYLYGCIAGSSFQYIPIFFLSLLMQADCNTIFTTELSLFLRALTIIRLALQLAAYVCPEVLLEPDVTAVPHEPVAYVGTSVYVKTLKILPVPLRTLLLSNRLPSGSSSICVSSPPLHGVVVTPPSAFQFAPKSSEHITRGPGLLPPVFHVFSTA